jgi:hypothetical protein
MASSSCIQSPIQGTQHPQALYLSLDWEVSFHAPQCGLAPSCPGFPPGITRETHLKPPGLELIEGHEPLYDPMERFVPWLALTPGR